MANMRLPHRHRRVVSLLRLTPYHKSQLRTTVDIPPLNAKSFIRRPLQHHLVEYRANLHLVRRSNAPDMELTKLIASRFSGDSLSSTGFEPRGEQPSRKMPFGNEDARSVALHKRLEKTAYSSRQS